MISDFHNEIRAYNIRRAKPKLDKCALLVIDMQEYFRLLASAIIGNIRSIITACRSSEILVIYTRHGHHVAAWVCFYTVRPFGEKEVSEGDLEDLNIGKLKSSKEPIGPRAVSVPILWISVQCARHEAPNWCSFIVNKCFCFPVPVLSSKTRHSRASLPHSFDPCVR